jgi:hypothetical protein
MKLSLPGPPVVTVTVPFAEFVAFVELLAGGSKMKVSVPFVETLSDCEKLSNVKVAVDPV